MVAILATPLTPRNQVSIVKEASKIKTLRLFEGTAVEIVDGCRVLGSVIVKEKAYETIKVTTAVNYTNLLKLGLVAKTPPQTNYTCLTRGVQQQKKFVSRTKSKSHPNAHPTVVLRLRCLNPHGDCIRYQPVSADLT